MASSRSHLCLVLAFFFAAGLQQGFAQEIPADSKELLVGFSRANITPTGPVTLAGYGSRTDLSTGIHDSLFARVAAFQSGQDRLVIVSSDILGYYRGTDRIFRERICEKHGLTRDQLFLSAVHTHAAPSPILSDSLGHPNNVVYTRWLLEVLTDAVGEALDDISPATLASGTGASPVGVNRREVVYDENSNPEIRLGRNPTGIHDRDVQVVTIDRKEKTAGILFNYAVHSTSLGPGNLLVSGDIHGIAERFVERQLDAPVLAFAGTSGDIDPWYRVLPGFQEENGWVPETILMGTMLGEEVVHVANQCRELPDVYPVGSVVNTLDLPAKTADNEDSDHQLTVPLNVGVARVGEAAFVCLGGEMLSEIGLRIKAASPFPQTFVFNHCNGTASYLAPAHLHLEGGYEIRTSPFAPAAADILIRYVTTELHALSHKKALAGS